MGGDPPNLNKKTGDKKEMELIDAMTDVVRGNGGRISETEYISQIADRLRADGKEPKMESLKTNCFNAGRMAKAGVTRVTVGGGNDATKEVWTVASAKALLQNGPGTTGSSSASVGNAPVMPQTGQVWMGVPVRDVANDETLDDAARSLIPQNDPGFVESAELELEGLADSMVLGLHSLLEGPKGCGKTIAVAALCYHTQDPMYRFNCSEGISEDDFVGCRESLDGNTVWVDGLVPRWAKTGGILFADEFNAASPSVMLWMHMAMDSGTIVLPTGETIELHPRCRVVAAINPPEDYAGLEELNEATRDRYAMGLEFDYLPADKEAQVLMDKSGNNDSQLAREVVALGNDLRRMKEDRTLDKDCSTRTLVQVMQIASRQSQTKAVERALVSKYDRHQREKVRTVARTRLSNFGVLAN